MVLACAMLRTILLLLVNISAVHSRTAWTLANHEHSQMRCREQAKPVVQKLVAGVKTTRFYHASRASALWKAWGNQLGQGLLFASDGPFSEANSWPASVIVVDDEVDSRRLEAYRPPWREGGADPGSIDPFALPQLTRRVGALIETMFACWGDTADWFLIVDDDTFLRPELLERALASLDPGQAHLLGVPVASDPFTLSSHQDLHGSSMHCGGNSVLLSRALLASFVHHIEPCLDGPSRTTLAWYWDEVELLGRCLYEHYRLNCSLVPQLEVPIGELDLGLMTSAKLDSEFHALADYVAEELNGNWSRLFFATLHPVEASRMEWLGSRFASIASREITDL